jgi:hypothetical protein
MSTTPLSGQDQNRNSSFDQIEVSQLKEERLKKEMREEFEERLRQERQEAEERFLVLQSDFRSALELVASKDREIVEMKGSLSESKAKLKEKEEVPSKEIIDQVWVEA